MYLSQDPIGLAGNNPTLYGYVKDVNSWVDIFGLDCNKKTRVRHYTNRKGSKSIKEEGVIKPRDNGRVYVESANKKPLSKTEAETKYELKEGRGRDYIETDVPTSDIEIVKNPRYHTEELTVKGEITLDNAKITQRK